MDTATQEFPYDVAVVIGRFQFVHNGHKALFKRALELGKTVVIVIGSSFHARTENNPFSWEEIAPMINLTLTPEEAQRVRFLPVRDYYENTAWVNAIATGVEGLGKGSTVLVGHYKDSSSFYLSLFPEWALDEVQEVTGGPAVRIDATMLRNALYNLDEKDDIEALWTYLRQYMAPGVVSFIKILYGQGVFDQLRQEYLQTKATKAAWACAPYAPTFITVDSVVTATVDNTRYVLLVRRGRSPGKGLLAVPGGFLEADESLYRSAVRELREETGFGLLDSLLDHAYKGVAVFDHPKRSTRGRTVTHAHYFDLGHLRALPQVDCSKDEETAAVQWFPVNGLTSQESYFFEDHFLILDHFLHFSA